MRIPLGILAVAVMAAGTTGEAQRAPPTVGQLEHSVFTIRAGAPAGIIVIAQSADGMLWLGTTTGLYQFDGISFEAFEPPAGTTLPTLAVHSLLALPDGRLWIGYGRGGVSVLDGDHLTSYGQNEGVPTGAVTALAMDSTGAVWAATTTGLAYFRGGGWHEVGATQGFSGGPTSSLLVDRRGTLWAPASAGVFVLPRGGVRFSKRAPPLDPFGLGGMLREAPNGSVWACSTTHGLIRLADSTGAPAASPFLEPSQAMYLMAIDRRENAWVVTRDAFVRIPLTPDPEGGRKVDVRLPRATPVPSADSAEVWSTPFADREGNMWVGTLSGLERYRETKFTPVTFPGGVRFPALVAGDRGSVWVGASSGYPLFAIESSVTVVRSGPNDISSAYRDLRGGVWLGGRPGLWYLPPGAKSAAAFARVALPKLAAGIEVQAIALSTTRDLWLSLPFYPARGVYRRRAGVWTRFTGPSGLQPNEYPATVIADSTGRTWLGYDRNQIVRVTGDSMRLYTEADGVRVGTVTSIFVRGAHVWAGGERGIAILDGERFRPVVATQPMRAVTGLIESSTGDLWVIGVGGITHIAAEDLRRALLDPRRVARAERLDYHDGFEGGPPQARPFPSAIEGTDGRLWFASETGVAWIDPANIPRNHLAPPVKIRWLSAGGRRYAATSPVLLPAKTRDLRIAYTAFSLTMPDRVSFKYRLDGADAAWSDAGVAREAVYANLPPGSHTFQVTAANEDGVWNATGTALAITIPPTFVQTRWFTAMLVSLLGAGIWLTYLVRAQRMAAVLRSRFEAALAERTRIAQELHDTLLQGFTGITFKLRAIQNRLVEAPAERRAELDDVLAEAETALRDARHMIWDMRSAEVEGRDVADTFEAAARQAVTGSSVGLVFKVSGERRRLPLEVETAAIRMGREAVVNALKHADAGTLEVHIEYHPHSLWLTVIDDGRGIAPGTVELATARGHWGIAGMKARAEGAGGKMEIASVPGRGTTVSISLPTAPPR